MPTLPAQALAHIPPHAQQRIADHGPFETYSTVSYVGTNAGVTFNGLLVEVDQDTWVENNLFVFQEVSETDNHVVLYDQSRETTLTLNLITNDLIVTFGSNQLNWDITAVSESLTPVIPDGWLV